MIEAIANTFDAGDVVCIDYVSPTDIEMWLRGFSHLGPGDIGVVVYPTGDRFKVGNVTVHFPVLRSGPPCGTFGVHSTKLRLLKKVGSSDE